MSTVNDEIRQFLDTHVAKEEVMDFGVYLKKIEANPELACTAHSRIYNMIRSHGVTTNEDGQEVYLYFGKEMFGIEDATREIMEYFKAAALGSDVSKRFLMLFGPPSSGKSNLVSMMKDDIERWTMTDAGAVYAISGCPMNEDPLNAVPKALRPSIENKLKVKIDGDLCPACAHKLRTEFGNDFTKFNVHRVYFSQQARQGIGTFAPSDPKCLTGDALILSGRGMLTFDEMQADIAAEDNQFKPFEVAISGTNGIENSSHFYNGGIKPIVRIKTKLGYEVKGSEVHPVLALDACGRRHWKKLSDICIGDRILLGVGQGIFGNICDLPEFKYDGGKPRQGNKDIVFPTMMTPALGRLLGYLVSEGSLTDTSVWFTNADKRLVDDFCTIAESLFGVRPKIYSPRCGKSTMDASISCVKLVAWLEAVCGLERGAANKTIPRIVRQGSKEVILAFIDSISWGDGHLNSLRGGCNTNTYKYASTSRELVRQMHVMLLNLGVVGSMYEEKREYEGDPYMVYTVQVTGDDVIDLLEQLSSLRDKNTSAVPVAVRSGRSNYDFIDASGMVRAIMNRAPHGAKAEISKFRRYSYAGPHARKFTRKSLGEFVALAEPYLLDYEGRILAEMANNNFLCLDVCEAERMDDEQVYDLTIPGSHSFCANGIICHNSQDIAELIGSVDLSKIGEYGTESDPRAYRFDGELNIANRGLVEFVEILKLDSKFLYVLLTATQEKCIKTPRFPFISIDEVIISHTNESEYKEFMGNPKNEALIDRMIVCRVPYNLKVDEEIKIYEKLLQHGDHKDLHIAPHTLRVAAIFAILSRLDEPKDSSLDKIKKMKLYNGEEVEGQSLKDVFRLRRESPTEGMDGISPRYVINRIVTTAIRGSEEGSRKWMTPIDVLRALKDGLVTSSKFKAEERSKYEALLGLAKIEFDQIARTEIQKAFFVSFEAEARTLMDNYIDHVEAYLEKRKLEDPISREEIEPDEKLMRSIETKIGIHDAAKESFRNEILRKVGAALRRGEKFSYEKHARLREAIEKQLFEERREIIKMTITSRTNQDPEQLKRINQVVDTLCQSHGYIPESANELLKYVSSIMAREK